MSRAILKCSNVKPGLLTTAAWCMALAVLCSQPLVRATQGTRGVSSQGHPAAGQKAQPSEPSEAAWQELKNHYGWSIRFPKNWQAGAIGDDTPETSESPDFQGPRGCYQRCAVFQIDAMPWQDDATSRMTPMEYFGGPDRDELRRGPICLAGHVGYQVFYLAKNTGGWSHPKPVRAIAVKHNGKMLTISYSEDAKNNESIKSPEDWTLTPLFEQILSTFRFTDDKSQECK